MKRPDTPLAATPEPQPVSSGLQPMNQQYAQPVSKYQATADAAIQQISKLSQESMPQPAAPAPSNKQQQQ
jgi:hypothetical protein